MKRFILVTPRSATREMFADSPDTERLLNSGGWLIAHKPRPRSRNAKAVDRWRKRQKEQGFHEMNVFLPERVFEELCAQQLDGETFALTIERLLGISGAKSKE